MAGVSQYKLLLEAKLDESKIKSEIAKLTEKTALFINIKFKTEDMNKLRDAIDSVKDKASSLEKITILGDKQGAINRAIIQYRDHAGEVVQQYETINDKVKIQQRHVSDLVGREKEINAILDARVKLDAKHADELKRAALQADKFLAKSKNLAKTPSVGAAVGKAQEIKIAVSEGDINKVRQLNDEFAIMKARLQTGRTGLDSWAEGMRNAIKQTVEYSLSIGLVYGALNQLKKGIEFVKELDREMTKIQVLNIENAQTNDEIANLALRYNDLADSLGATTIQVAEGSVEWLRQGKTIEETGELMSATMHLSKLGALESAQATEYLTAILNGFASQNIEASEAVDKLIAVDNVAATSAGELATALQYSSAVANQAGVSFDSLVAMIGAVSSTTRLSAEMIGTAFRSIFVRMQQVKAGAIDETGMSLNNVEKSLANVGIALRDSVGSFRPLEDVIEDVALEWDNLSEVQQAQIANAIAGQRQAQIFMSLMQNWGDVTEYLGVEMESTGLALKNYGVYMESVEAKQNQLTASWEKMWMATIDSGMIEWFFDAGKGVLDFVTALGGLKPILQEVIILLIAFNAVTIKDTIGGWVVSAGNFAKSLVGLGTTAKATAASMGTVLGVVVALNLAIVAYNEVVEVSKMVQDGNAEVANNWANGLQKVAKETDSSQAVLERYKKSVEDINAIYKDAAWYVKPFIDKQDMLKAGLRETEQALRSTANTYEEYITAVRNAAESIGYEVDEHGNYYRIVRDGAGIRKEYLTDVEVMTLEQFGLTKSLEETSGEMVDAIDVTGELGLAYKSLAETLGEMTDAQSSLTDLMDKAEAGDLQIEDLDELAGLYPDYLEALTIEGDKLKLNTDMIREYLVAKADKAVADAQAAGATEKEIQLLQMYAESLRQQQYEVINGIQVTSQQASQVYWDIANQAAMSGQSFVDLQGKALNSAQAIYDFMRSGDASFNSFIQQAANVTGQSVQAISNQISNMLMVTQSNIANTINSIIAMGQAAGATMGTIGSLLAGATAGGLPAPRPRVSPIFTPAPAGYQYPGGLRDYAGSGGGGGRDRDREREEEEAQIQSEIEDAMRSITDALKDQLKEYRRMIDMRREMLDSLREERDYNRTIEEQQRDILKIQNELATLQFDTSEEAQARRLQLEEELRDAQRDLEDTQFEHAIKSQQDALEAEYDAAEARILSAIDAIENIDADSLEDFQAQLELILKGLHERPSGGQSAFSAIGGNPLRGASEFLAGEPGGISGGRQTYSNLSKIVQPIPDFDTAGGGSSISVSMPINVAGNLDKSVMPDLEIMVNKVVDKLNGAMLTRGYNRRADAFSI